MKAILNFFIVLVLSCEAGRAQQESGIYIIDDDPTPIYYEWLGTESKTLTKMNLVYSKPDGFKEDSKSECFKGYPVLARAFRCIENQLISDDNQLIAFMPIYRPLTQTDSMRFQRIFPKHTFDFVDKQHLLQIQHLIKEYQGEDTAEKMIDLLTYYSEDETKHKFNADTVIRYSLKLKRKDYYKEKFKYVDLLCLQKNDYW